MKIVYLLSYFELVGGQEFYLARQQAKQGHQVIVIACDLFYPVPGIKDRYRQDGFGEEWIDRHPGKMVYQGITIYRLPTVFHYQDFIVVRGVKQLLRELKPDVVFAHEPRTIVPMLGAKYKHELGYVYFVDTHDFFHKVQNHNWWRRFLRYAEYFWWRRWFVEYAMNRADRIFAVAEECRKFLVTHHHIPNERIDSLPLSVETDFFEYSGEARTKVRARLGIGEKDIALVFAGYMFRRKALESLIELVAQASDLPLHLIFAGEGPADYVAELKAQAQKLGVEQRVHFTGFLSRKDVTQYFSAADIGVWPGNNSLVILEAMACRLPIVMADMQLAHLVSHDNGLKVSYADVSALEAAIHRLATNEAERKRMGLAGEKIAREKYSYAASAAHVGQLMEEALSKKKETLG